MGKAYMRINEITTNFLRGYRTGQKRSGSHGNDFEDAVKWKGNALWENKRADKSKKSSAVEIYNSMCRFEGYPLELEKEKMKNPELREEKAEESETQTKILEKPDGSKVMLITMNFGGTEMTTSVEIAKPTALPIMDEKQTYETYQSGAIWKDDSQSAKAGSSARDYRERAFNQVGANAPESVKKAWLDAADKAGVDGLGISNSGKLSHITQMMVQRFLREYHGENGNDILGGSVQSAIRAANDALYALEHPLAPNSGRTAEEIKNREKEKLFYQEFLNRLYELC